MRKSIKRNTGKIVTMCSFQIPVKLRDKVEEISKKREVSSSVIFRESVEKYTKPWF